MYSIDLIIFKSAKLYVNILYVIKFVMNMFLTFSQNMFNYVFNNNSILIFLFVMLIMFSQSVKYFCKSFSIS